jgi:antibiotic biosynthesis monooxygenase (ABM) superfamily enzyme
MPRPRLPHGGPAASPEDSSVTVTVARKVAVGREADFEQWVQGIVEAAAKFPGFLGAGALRPPEAGREWHVVYRFADADKQRAWEASAERAAWLARADEFAHHTGTTHVSGLETWFALPGRTAPAPPKWKMAVVTFAAIYPLALLANVVLAPRTAAWPLLFRPIAFAGVLVPLMTWIVMPRLTRLLRRWLYPR